MITIKTGQAVNIPWWRLQTMSDKEIEEHNSKFMMIDGLTDSVGNMEFPFNKIKEETEFLKDRSISLLCDEIWNAAIEAAAKEIEDGDDGKFQASKIRSLKK